MCTSRRLHLTISFHFLEVAGSPASVESGTLRSIEAEVDKPALARDGLDPLSLLARRCARPKVKVGRSSFWGIFQFDEGTQRSLVLIGLDLRAREGVIDRDRPEQFLRYRLRHAQSVGLAAIEVPALLVAKAEPIE